VIIVNGYQRNFYSTVPHQIYPLHFATLDQSPVYP
jgi:hypothetical protein